MTRKQKWEEKQHYGYLKRQTTEISHKKRSGHDKERENLKEKLNLFK